MNDDICFCVHGAIQRIVNPVIRVWLNLPKLPELSIAEQLRMVKESLTPETWIKGSAFRRKTGETLYLPTRPDILVTAWEGAASHEEYSLLQGVETCNENPSYADFGFGSATLHFFAGMFGLTEEFNDSSDTSLEMVHERLDQAIKFAETLT